MINRLCKIQIVFIKILGLAKNGREYFSQAQKQLRSKQIRSTEESNDSKNFFHYFDTEVNVLP